MRKHEEAGGFQVLEAAGWLGSDKVTVQARLSYYSHQNGIIRIKKFTVKDEKEQSSPEEVQHPHILQF